MTTTGDGIVGTTLGSFRITKVIGRGGMGTVYLGEHTVTGSKVAIKVLQEKLAADEGLVARFYAEAGSRSTSSATRPSSTSST